MGKFFSSIWNAIANKKLLGEFMAAIIATETQNPYYFYPAVAGRSYRVTVEKLPTP